MFGNKKPKKLLFSISCLTISEATFWSGCICSHCVSKVQLIRSLVYNSSGTSSNYCLTDHAINHSTSSVVCTASLSLPESSSLFKKMRLKVSLFDINCSLNRGDRNFIHCYLFPSPYDQLVTAIPQACVIRKQFSTNFWEQQHRLFKNLQHPKVLVVTYSSINFKVTMFGTHYGCPISPMWMVNQQKFYTNGREGKTRDQVGIKRALCQFTKKLVRGSFILIVVNRKIFKVLSIVAGILLSCTSGGVRSMWAFEILIFSIENKLMQIKGNWITKKEEQLLNF